MRIALRDDDTCYYTHPEELEQAFDCLGKFPITLSVVPFAVWEHAGTFPYGNQEANEKYMPLEENRALVEYLKQGIQNGKYEIALHGVHHEYRCNDSGEWEPETIWLKDSNLKAGIEHGKNYLERVLHTSIRVFAAPSNAVPESCANALDELGIHVNCHYCKRFERSFSLRYLMNYLKCNTFRLMTGQRYSGVLQERNHREMAIFEFADKEQMIRQFEVCQKYNMDLVIFTHYWDLNEHPEKKRALADFLNYAQAQGAIPAHLSQCFE